jgi:hypothetical protein
MIFFDLGVDNESDGECVGWASRSGYSEFGH